MPRQPSQAQTLIFKGIYEFEDPSGSLLAARIPQVGSVDLFRGTAVVVRPNQYAMFIYKGQFADILKPGTHFISSENVPLLTRLANWHFGFRSPLRCEIWFFSGSVFTARRWGTARPILAQLDMGTVPIRGYGNYNIRITDPRALYEKLIGARTSYDITDLEEYIQGHILELLPQALKVINSVKEINQKQDEVSEVLEKLLFDRLSPFGLQLQDIQVASLLPPKDVLEALDSRIAMDVIGNQREFLLYKAANSLDALQEGSSSGDSMQMMLGLMLGKGLLEADYHSKEQKVLPMKGGATCGSCQNKVPGGSRFCPNCGAKQSQ